MDSRLRGNDDTLFQNVISVCQHNIKFEAFELKHSPFILSPGGSMSKDESNHLSFAPQIGERSILQKNTM